MIDLWSVLLILFVRSVLTLTEVGLETQFCKQNGRLYRL
jgi:hypothetical protein